VNRIDPSGHDDFELNSLGAGVSGASSIGSSLGSAVTRAYLNVIFKMPQILDATAKAAYYAELGVVGLTFGAALLESAGHVSTAIDRAFSQNNLSISPGWATRGRQLENVAGQALESDGGRLLGGNVKTIDGVLAVVDQDALVSIRSHNVISGRLISTIRADMEQLSKASSTDLYGITKDGLYFERQAAKTAGEILVVDLPEAEAAHIIDPQFATSLRQLAQQMRVIPIVRAVRGWK
ncbi:MAG TPA: hypothetical protein VMF06_05715, partial [Candidatus Limnocylindria bacterium]|nr:hypothetical protein [Candidatus Limnocylindria bacterium]